MGDRELLELAAKAVGRKIYYNYLGSQDCNRAWYPLDDDGDALRLASHLCMNVSTGPCRASASTISGALRGAFFEEDTCQQDQDCAVRRAIVRAAAEIGENMP